ncbi:MAG: hypothetical protein HQL50_13255 [Magnetococcales bacterium]|nr:hypothetical protein [Magnetococcales bacterium]
MLCKNEQEAVFQIKALILKHTKMTDVTGGVFQRIMQWYDALPVFERENLCDRKGVRCWGEECQQYRRYIQVLSALSGAKSSDDVIHAMDLYAFYFSKGDKGPVETRGMCLVSPPPIRNQA